MLANAVFLSFAYASVTTATVHLMSAVFFPGGDKTFALAGLNLGFIAIGFGAFVGPMIVQAIEQRWGYRQGLLYVSVVGIVPAVLTMLAEAAQFPALPAEPTSWEVVLLQPPLGMIAGVILLYFALENCLDFWPEPYLEELGYRERGQQTGMALFWLAFIAMRGVAAWWLYFHPGFAAIIILVVLSALVVGNLAGGYEVGSGTVGFLARWALLWPAAARLSRHVPAARIPNCR